MNSIVSLKTVNESIDNDKFQVKYEVLSPIDISTITDSNRREIALALQDLDKQINLCDEEIARLSVEIDNLTNHADGLDYAVAVASGILTGLIDSFFVGDYNPSVEDVVTNFAKKKSGGKVSNYDEAQEYLQKRYHTQHDGAYTSGKDNAGNPHHVYAKTHRLDDFTHHPTFLGLLANILVMYFKKNVLINRYGEAHTVDIPTSTKEVVKTWMPAVLSGLMIWIANVAENYVEEQLDTEIPQPIKRIIKLVAASPMIIQILRCAENWYGHILSDVATPAGVPGIFLSLLKEISSLPGINRTNLPLVIQTLYNKKKLDDFGSELAFVEKLKKQAIPVIINEVIVRGFYFVRRLINEYQTHKNLVDIDWEKAIPFGNRTVERMMTIASGTFTAVDMADAVIRSGGFNAACVLRVNFVGVGRFVIAIGVDVGMGIKRNKLRNERMDTYNHMLMLSGAKVYYLEAGMWRSAIDTGKTLEKTMEIAENSIAYFAEAWQSIEADMQITGEKVPDIVDFNSDFAQEILDELDY